MGRVAVVGKYQVKVMGVEDYQAIAACRAACPLHTDAKGYARAIAAGDYEKAYLIARQTNPLVFVCSRVCHAPCERACRRGEVDAPVAIRALKRFVCDSHRVESPSAVKKVLERLSERGDLESDRVGNDVVGLCLLAEAYRGTEIDSKSGADRVAVIGSGPAGLAAAHDLALLGYGVTVFESAPLPGGMLRTGIPEFRLRKKVVQEEIDAILNLGVEIELNSPIGRGRSLGDLRELGYKAVFIAIGLQAPLTLDLENAGLAGVREGITFLRDFEKLPVGDVCLAIGGGGVAIDCAQLALRQGAKRVMVACVESWETMPAGAPEKEDARDEGIRFYTSLGPKRIVGQDGKVTGVEFLEVESVFDDEGSFNPTLRPGTETLLEADTVILAIGQSSTLSALQATGDLETTPAGRILVDDDLRTSVAGIFAGGDIRAGHPRSVVDSIADGQKAARSIHEYMSGKSLRTRREGFMRVLGPGFENTGSETIKAVKPPKRSVRARITSGAEIDLTYEEEQARREASRCQQCDVQTVFNRKLCILCGTCVDGCVSGALKMVRLEDIRGDVDLERLTKALRGDAPHAREMTAIIKDESACVRCGLCARRCPTGAITMEVFHSQEEWEYE